MLPTFASAMLGNEPTVANFGRAARLTAMHDCTPIDDVRSTANYPRLVLRNVLATLLTDLTHSTP